MTVTIYHTCHKKVGIVPDTKKNTNNFIYTFSVFPNFSFLWGVIMLDIMFDRNNVVTFKIVSHNVSGWLPISRLGTR